MVFSRWNLEKRALESLKNAWFAVATSNCGTVVMENDTARELWRPQTVCTTIFHQISASR